MDLQGIIFDMGGVLVRTLDPTPREQVAAQLNTTVEHLYHVVFGGESWRQAQLGHISNDEHWQQVGQQLGLRWPDEVNAFRREFFAGDCLDPEMVSLVRELRSRYRLGLLSNAPAASQRWLERLGLLELFDAVVISGLVGVMKPDARIYRLALQRLNLLPQEALFVDDDPANVEGALAVGMEAVLFTDPTTLYEELKRRGTL